MSHPMPDPSPILGSRDQQWLDYLLPSDRPGYARLMEHIRSLVVLGEGRWGAGDLVLGRPDQAIDLEAGMEPVAAYGEIHGRDQQGADAVITLSVHFPDEEGRVEFQRVGSVGSIDETRRWTYSSWSPQLPCPATAAQVREVILSEREDAPRELRLVISPMQRSIWLYDAIEETNTLLPLTNFYSELMRVRGERDPAVRLNHGLLFSRLDEIQDPELLTAFVNYNSQFRKVPAERLTTRTPTSDRRKQTILERITGIFRGGSE
jgi:hypothetical protein